MTFESLIDNILKANSYFDYTTFTRDQVIKIIHNRLKQKKIFHDKKCVAFCHCLDELFDEIKETLKNA